MTKKHSKKSSMSLFNRETQIKDTGGAYKVTQWVKGLAVKCVLRSIPRTPKVKKENQLLGDVF